jgi:glyoxylase-like metal-dependent hydrolase (beta-lactamase superfamily II)
MIIEKLVVGPIQANCFVIGDEKTKEGAIIDPGGNGDMIAEKVGEMGLDIKYIIATHGHFDHNAGLKKLRDAKIDAPFLVHKNDDSFVEESKRSAERWGLLIDQVPDADEHMKEGDVLKVGELELEIIHTPGHSPGGISIYIKSEGILFSGDTLFYRSIGRTDFREGSMEDLQNSIRKKLYKLPDDTVVYTGHNSETTIGDEKRSNMFVPEI